MLISFNRYINDYILQDIIWEDTIPKTTNYQHISFEELRYYIGHILKDTPKDNILLRHQDELISPLNCWLEDYIDNSNALSLADLEYEVAVDKSGLAFEFFNTMSFGAEVFETEIPEFIDVGKLWITYHVQKEHYEKMEAIFRANNRKP